MNEETQARIDFLMRMVKFFPNTPEGRIKKERAQQMITKLKDGEHDC